MWRNASFEVLVLPYSVELDGHVSYAVFRGAGRRERAWHALAGESIRDESPLEAARREAWRAAEIPADAVYLALQTRTAKDPSEVACWVAAYAFAVRVLQDEVRPRRPGLEHHWVAYEIAEGLLHAQPDRDALWELRQRLGRPATCC